MAGSRAGALAAALLLGPLGTAAFANEGAPAVAADPQTLERLERRAYRALLDLQIQTEGRDATWADEIEGRLQDTLAGIHARGLHIHDVRCAASLCRVELGHDSPAGQQQLLAGIAGAPGFDLPGLGHAEDDDRGLVTYIYLSRAGGWPDPPQPPRISEVEN